MQTTAPRSDLGKVPEAGGVASNVLWTVLSVFVNLFTGIILSPYIIRKLGSEGYGIWSLLFALAGYCTLFDAGVRSAVVTFAARLRAKSDPDGINRLISTALACSAAGSAGIVLLTWALWANPRWIFTTNAAQEPALRPIVVTIGFSTAIGLVSGVLTGCLEGFQRFDHLNRIRTSIFSLRAAMYALTLYAGFGLVQMAFWTGAANLALLIAYYVMLRRLFPGLRLSPALVGRSTLKEILHFGIPSSLASSASVVIDQSPAILIGRALSAADVGFYNFPLRLLQYPVDLIMRIGVIATPAAAEMQVSSRYASITRMGVLANRYNFLLYSPLAIFLLVHGTALMRVWVGPEYAAASGTLIPVFAAGIWFAIAGQFVTSSVLFGLGAHRIYSLLLAVEGAIVVVGGVLALRSWGLPGVACVCAAALSLNRGIAAPVLLCRAVKYPLVKYMAGVYGRALALVAPVCLLALWSSRSWLPGRNWAELFLMAGLITVLIGAGGLAACIDPGHRRLLFGRAAQLCRAASRRLF